MAQSHDEDIRYYLFVDSHRRASRWSDIILDGQDGLENALGVVVVPDFMKN